MKLLYFLVGLLCLGQAEVMATSVDVIHYEALIEPNLTNRSIKGKVNVLFKVSAPTREVSFNCGRLQIEQLSSPGIGSSFVVKNQQLHIVFREALTPDQPYEVRISYRGEPRRGLVYHPDIPSMTTVFSTSQWMVCQDTIDDKATLDLSIIAPSGLRVVASGRRYSRSEQAGGKVIHRWIQKKPVSSYIFGFAIGPFNLSSQVHQGIQLHYLSTIHSPDTLQQIFAETRNMLDFFESKAGLSYPDSSYTQILFKGGVSQEMAGFTVIRSNYGEQVLADAEAINLAAHELAHQWWGNWVTCKDWTHFWLNEGLAVYMSTAFREHRWGKAAYESDMKVYYDAFQKVVKKGQDKALHFPDWNSPTSDDRILVYYKGAYVFHLLRETLGDALFWQALKTYTQIHAGQSVTSQNLQQVFEKVSQRDLSSFFNTWVYPKK